MDDNGQHDHCSLQSQRDIASECQALIAGGNNLTDSNSLSSAELFNPATGTRQGTGSLNVAREGQLSALPQNGKVLVAGGRDFVNGTIPISLALSCSIHPKGNGASQVV